LKAWGVSELTETGRGARSNTIFFACGGKHYDQEDRNVAFLEYAWDMRGCDPCAADPLSAEELRRAGVFWLSPDANRNNTNVFITRLHVRYTRDKFPEDLIFQDTGNRRFFQGRYVMNHAFTSGADNCEARYNQLYPGNEDYFREMFGDEQIQGYIQDYYQNYVRRTLPNRFERAPQTLSRLTGWHSSDIRHRTSEEVPQPSPAIWRIRYPRRPDRGTD